MTLERAARRWMLSKSASAWAIVFSRTSSRARSWSSSSSVSAAWIWSIKAISLGPQACELVLGVDERPGDVHRALAERLDVGQVGELVEGGVERAGGDHELQRRPGLLLGAGRLRRLDDAAVRLDHVIASLVTSWTSSAGAASVICASRSTLRVSWPPAGPEALGEKSARSSPSAACLVPGTAGSLGRHRRSRPDSAGSALPRVADARVVTRAAARLAGRRSRCSKSICETPTTRTTSVAAAPPA